jgi:signal transduction histidine kinase
LALVTSIHQPSGAQNHFENSPTVNQRGNRQIMLITRHKLYLLLVYAGIGSLAFWVWPENANGIGLLLSVCIAVLAVLAYEPILSSIEQATGTLGSGQELKIYAALIDLNAKIHKLMNVDDVLTLVSDVLKEKARLDQVIFLINSEFSSTMPEGAIQNASSNDGKMLLQPWPNPARHYQFLTDEFLGSMHHLPTVITRSDGIFSTKMAFDETDTSLLVNIMQGQTLLCVILISRVSMTKSYTALEYQVFEYLANQLSIVLDRIRIYEKVMRKTAMDHAEKMQVMESLSANIAHEMRTPLSGIRAHITGMEDYLPQLLNAHAHARSTSPHEFDEIREDHLQTLRSMPDKIKLMIDQAHSVIDMLLMNLRDNSKDRTQLMPCSAAGCVLNAIDRYPFKTGERQRVQLEINQDFVFMGVESLFIYVLFNLLKNALYSVRSAGKGNILIRLEVGQHINTLVFRDEGEGIKVEVMPHIFEGFFTTKADGTGAGLAFCKRTIKRFGGEILCHSQPGEFTEFQIKLPTSVSVPLH